MPIGEKQARRVTYSFLRPPHRRSTFTADLLEIDGQVMVLASPLEPSRPLTYEGQVVLDRGYSAVWFLYNGQPWDIARVYRPDGQFTGFYSDVLEPVRWTGEDPDTLEPIVDLFLDLWIASDGKYEVLDEDEFQEAVDSGAISERQAEHARATLRGLEAGVRPGDFPPARVRDFRL